MSSCGHKLSGGLNHAILISNLKSPENDNDAIHKKYLIEQLNLIEVNKNHLNERIGDVKRFFKRQLNNKDFIDDTKLQQEVTSLKNFIQQQLVNVVDKTQLQTLDDKIAKQKIDLKQLIANINPGISEDKLTALESKLSDDSEIQKQIVAIQQQLINVVDKTQLQNLSSLISNLDDKITKQKIELIDISEDKLQRELTKFKTELQKELTNIQQNIDDSVIQQQITTINNLVLKQDKNIIALEKKFLKKESYYFNIPFRFLGFDNGSITDNIDKSKDYEYKTYGFTANIRLYSVPNYTILPKKIFDVNYPYIFKFRGKLTIEITFPIQVKVDSLFFRQNSISSNRQFNARKVLQFINGTKNVETKELEINDENNKVNHLYEIKTSGKYIDMFRMLIIPDNEKDEFTLSDFDMILETETPPSMNIIRNPEPEKKDISRYQFLRATDFEYVKLYFVDNDIFTSVDIHKSQQNQKFLIRDGVYVNISIYIEKPKFSVHLNKINDSKEQISLVTVRVNSKAALSEVHLI
ncbi:hypothetical protein LOTGIDRAFT_163761 [Lottia gigantea]|uniref:Uncharacterized protein n=1 Tax=Lottia gigantea TaxID=225164 RepID=V4BPU0_LOTGI|nr:hypothetical protein LOTGIDRAFT_163761 [Lottia gigantea]ESO90874.1 hypothetical protein LOTGIDRAFT_163761 [Lottia gigantea]